MHAAQGGAVLWSKFISRIPKAFAPSKLMIRSEMLDYRASKRVKQSWRCVLRAFYCDLTILKGTGTDESETYEDSSVGWSLMFSVFRYVASVKS